MLIPSTQRLTMNCAQMVDAVIVGGGPAGVSAAGLLGQRMRKVAIVDASGGGVEPDSAPRAITEHGEPTPYESLRAGWEQLRNFETVTWLQSTVADVEGSSFGFTVHFKDGATIATRVLLLASDILTPAPAIKGAEQFYGRSLHECPYCDGWEHRDRRIGVLGADEDAVDMALKLLQWSSRVTLYSNGGMVGNGCLKRLDRGKVQVVTEIITALEGQDRNLELLRTHEASSHLCEALFFSSARKYHSSLAARLGCDLERMAGAVHWRPDGDQLIEGLFMTGNTLNTSDITSTAASEGLKAAKAANEWLRAADHSTPAAEPVPSPPQTFHQTIPQRRIAI